MSSLETIVSAGSLAMALLGVAAAQAAGSAPPKVAPPETRDGQRDFDFLIGSWKVKNRRLEKPLTGSTTWYEFEATNVCRKVWDGLANMDEFEGQLPTGPVRGMTVRLYDPKTRQWSLTWANSKTGVFDKPMFGEFQDGVGRFYDQEPFEGRQIYVRYIWSRTTTGSPRWEQAFSADGGQTWETNWIMDFTRVE